MAAMLHDIIIIITANMPSIHATSYVDHEKRVAWFSISMHAFGSFSTVVGSA